MNREDEIKTNIYEEIQLLINKDDLNFTEFKAPIVFFIKEGEIVGSTSNTLEGYIENTPLTENEKNEFDDEYITIYHPFDKLHFLKHLLKWRYPFYLLPKLQSDTLFSYLSIPKN